MLILVALLFFFGQPFWEARPPEKWSDREIATILENSPWAQTARPDPAVVVYFATARPIEEAESELRLRSKQPIPEPDPEYVIYVSDNRARQFVLAVPYPRLTGLGRAEEQKRLQEESVMVIGRKSYHIVGEFPPTPADPVLRLIFPREVKQTDKNVVFRLYLAGLDFPEREVEFNVKDLFYGGKLEM